MATMNRRPMRGGRPNPAQRQRPAPPPMVNRSPGGRTPPPVSKPAVMPAPVSKPAVMPPPVSKPAAGMERARLGTPPTPTQLAVQASQSAGGSPARGPQSANLQEAQQARQQMLSAEARQAPVMPANGGFIPGAMGGPSKLNSSSGGPSNNMPVGGGVMGGAINNSNFGGAMGAKPFAKGGKVSAKAPVKAKSTCMKTGGMVKSSASSRGDGIAQRGKTRGKYC